MAGHEAVNHGVYKLEQIDRPPGYLLSAVDNQSTRVSKNTKHELRIDAKKSGVKVSYEPTIQRDGDDPTIPLVLFGLKKNGEEQADFIERVKRLTGKFFPGVVTIVPNEIE